MERAGDAALVGCAVPHAAAVGVATAAIEVGGGAVINAGVVDEGAGGVGGAVEFTNGEISDVVVAGARVAALSLGDVPLAFGLLVAVAFVVVAVGALVLAAALVELADVDKLASGGGSNLDTVACADATVVVPLTGGVLRARTVGCVAEGTSAAAVGESLVAPRGLRLGVAAASGGTSILIGVQAVGTAGLTLDDIDVADGK